MAMEPVNIDFVGRQGAQGDLAGLLLAQGKLDTNRMRPYIGKDGRSYMVVCTGNPRDLKSYREVPIQTNATLRRDEWKQLDEAVLMASQIRLGGVQDLIDNNLIFNLGNAMGTTVLEYHDVSDAMTAEMTMDGISRGQGDRPAFGTNYLPLPIIHADFEINQRVLEASRRLGNPLDTTSVELATRKVLEKLEVLLFTSISYTFGGGTIYSYLNQPYRNQVTLSTHWDHSAASGATILADVLAVKQASVSDRHYGPWMLYIPTAYERTLDDDYASNYPKSIRARILEISGIKGIKVVDTLTADNVLLVQMTIDVVRLIRGTGVQVVEWKNEGGMITKYKVMTIQVPQVRADQAQRSGVVHLA